MERLTKKLGNGLVRPFIDGKPVPIHYMDMKDIQARLDRLAAYEDAEEAGLLVRLPCKVGDTVFRIWNGEIEQYQVVSVWFNDHIKRMFHAECFPYLRFYDEDIGKRIFLTREEAEAALKGGTGDV